MNMGTIYENQKKLKQALENYQKSAQLNNESQKAQENI
jgi:hypothetical protein